MRHSAPKFLGERERRLAYDHRYFASRAWEASSQYLRVDRNPLRPVGLVTDWAAYFSQLTSDAVRLVHDNPRRIPSLSERSRTMDSIAGGIDDAMGAAGDLVRVKPLSAVGKATSAILAVGDTVLNAAADVTDTVLNVDHGEAGSLSTNARSKLYNNLMNGQSSN